MGAAIRGRKGGIFVIAATGDRAHDRAVAPRDVVLVVYPRIQTLDLIGPVEVFAAANDEARRPAYRTTIAARDASDGSVTSSSGVLVGIDAPLASLRRPIDTLVVVGG